MQNIPYEYVGAVHMHTVHSDGVATHKEIAQIADHAGLDYVIVTDHNVHVSDVEGQYGNVLLLVGEEVHDPARKPEGSHLLIFRVGHSLAAYAQDLQSLINAVREAGGICFLAHPFEHSAAYSGESDINWRDWDVEGYTGIELWNIMSEFKSHVLNLPQALLMVFFPDWGLRGPYPETLGKWDDLLSRGHRVAVIGGPDAHGTIYRKGPLKRPVLGYDWLFWAVRLHVFCPEPLNGDLTHDADQVYDAIQNGRSFVAYDWIGDAAGFRFTAHSNDGSEAGMGQELVFTNDVIFEVTSPRPAHLRLIRHGHVVAAQDGQTLSYKTQSPGAYRVEAYRRHRLRRRGWVFTNPIYLIKEA